jgi:hypothetical protein
VAPMSPLVRAARLRLLSGKRGEEVIAHEAKRRGRLAAIRSYLAMRVLRGSKPPVSTAPRLRDRHQHEGQ